MAQTDQNDHLKQINVELKMPDDSKVDQIICLLKQINNNLLNLVAMIAMDHSVPKINRHGKFLAKVLRLIDFKTNQEPSPEPSGEQDV